MVNLTSYQIEGVVEGKKRCIAPVGIETTFIESQSLDTTALNERILTVVEKVTIIEFHAHTAPKLHDTVSTIVNVRIEHAEVGGLHQVKAVGTTAVKVTVLHQVLSSSSHTDHTSRAVAAFSMANRQVLYLTMIAINQIETIGITGIHLDTGVALTLDNQSREVHQRQLTTIRL